MKFKFRMRWSWRQPIEVEIAAEFEGRNYGDQFREALRVVLDLHRKWRRGENGGARADLTGADLTGADLTGAVLTGADLTGAVLTDADLTGAVLTDAVLTRADLTDKHGNRIPVTRAPLVLTGLDYRVTVWDQHLQIGCEVHTPEAWRSFDDRRIAEMDGRRALRFWAAHKGIVLALAESDGRGVAAAEVAPDAPAPAAQAEG